MQIKAAVCNEKGADLNIEEVTLAKPEKHEVLVKVVACGICGSDEGARVGLRTPWPSVLGHEGSGIVVEVGPEAEGFEVGDHVIMSYASDGWCPNCKKNRPFYCHDFIKINFKGINKYNKTPLTRNGEPLAYFFGQSSLATHAICEDRNLVKVDKDLDLRMLGPLGCGIQTGAGSIMNALKPEKGSSIAIFGTGPVGLSAVMAAKIMGCETIICFDVFPDRLELAKELGATHAFNTKEVKDPVQEIMNITDNVGVDYAFDHTGREDCLKNALSSMHQGGVGGGVAPTGKVTLDPWVNFFIGRTWHSIVEGEGVPQTFIPHLLDLYKEGKFPFDKMIEYFPFENINEAFAASRNGSAVKCVVVMPE